MEKEMGEKEKQEHVFDHKKMETPQKATMLKDWKAFKKFFKENSETLMEPFDLAENTAFHVATRSNNPQLFKELMEMLPVKDRWHALRKKNSHKNTILHHAILCKNVEMVNMVLYLEEIVPKPPDEDINDEEAEEKEMPLLELTNELGETPLYRAARAGKLKMLKHLAKRVDLRKHYHRKCADRKRSILHAAVLGQYFDVAIWLLRKDKGLADEKDMCGLTCLQLLSKMPNVFFSHSRMGTIEKLIYSFLPEQGYDDDDSIKILRKKRYEERADKDQVQQKKRDQERADENKVQQSSVLSRVNQAIWKFLAQEWEAVEHIWEKKKQHMLAEELAEILVKKDKSWKKTCKVRQRSVVVLPVINHPSNNVSKEKKQSEPNYDKENHGTEQHASVYTPLLLAAGTGIVEIVERIIDLYPEAINHVSEDEQNILHVAVKHRQMKIYKIIKRYGALKWLGNRISNKGRTLLHQVARMDYYKAGKQAGVAFQLQDELHWFERVKKIIPPYFSMHCNEDNLTAREQFELEHADMLKQAQSWIKETAQSCSAVAVLVATVVFAAAYTVPGGSNEHGLPVFLHSPVFLFFAIMDVVGLASSLASVVMFLSILTSPFEMQDFYRSLPRKLTLGFTLLFFSLTSTMLAFTATILLTIRLDANKWTSSLIYSAAFFPVTIFGLVQFPFYVAIEGRLKRVLKKLNKFIPSSWIKSDDKPKIKKIKFRY